MECQFCQEPFASRNALFRHLRTNADCFQKASEVSGNSFQVPLPKQKVGIRFGYYVHKGADAEAPNEQAALLVQRAFLESLRAHQPVREEDAKAKEVLTQTSATKLRHPCLAQDADCSAASDFIGINFQGENVTQVASILPEVQERVDQDLPEGITKIHLLDARILPVSSKFQAEG